MKKEGLAITYLTSAVTASISDTPIAQCFLPGRPDGRHMQSVSIKNRGSCLHLMSFSLVSYQAGWEEREMT